MDDSISKWLEKTPNHTCFRINRLKAFNIQKLVNILLLQRNTLNLNEIPHHYFIRPDCLIINQWPETIAREKGKHEVIVDAACGAAVLRGSHVYAPGVLGLPPGCTLDALVDIYADLDEKCKRGLKVEYLGNKKYVGTGHLKKLRSHLFDEGIQPSGVAVETICPESKLVVVNETCFSSGHVVLQNLPSIVCSWVVNPQPNENILDMCAAPGNKTTHLGEMSNNKAFITAIDRTEKKVELIKKNCELQGLNCINAFAYDSRKIHSETGNERGPPPYPSNYFDKILLDAPCSGLGQRPRLISNNMSPKMLQSYKYVQRKLFEAAVKVLKVGGKLVYSTCTITIEENEGLVKWALENFPNIKLIAADPLCGGPGLANCGLIDTERAMVQRFGPHEDPLRPVDLVYKNSIGFFIAAFEKLENN
ncbi:tRNA (cytosine(72)-C(5))-methyltransferase NSUN6 isoform X1 [Pieris brassicae]|uniref:tRNA (cytosine(72)-C(5))-methyltransferase NSUN6 isoform X1 n=1 Tax=Pieris brassicae TaxID=7116 RepID=UPI001E662571|nr:tRNA (cytosine(72)-C(5))-methyltransferase NSUN6 isoform X1 [Pieris brassicae]